LEAARLGFLGYLRRKGFSSQFVDQHAEDLMGHAYLEYSRKLAAGGRIENPPGWLIECAWRRTKSLLETLARTPRVVSAETTIEMADEGAGPEDALLDADRWRKVHEAVEQLSADERRLLALSYFEGFSVRESGRLLRWHSSRAQRTHERARERLHEVLGVGSSDELEIAVGLASYLSLAPGPSWEPRLPGGVEAMLDTAGRAAHDALGRAQDLARRVLSGGAADPSGAPVAAGAVRTAGACGAAALACVAAGVVGVGEGGPIGVLAPNSAVPEEPARKADAQAPRTPPAPILTPVPAAPNADSQGAPVSETESAGTRRKANRSANASGQSEIEPAEEQFDGLTRAAADEAAGPPAEPTASTVSRSGGSSEGSRSQRAPPAVVRAEDTQARNEFGAFK
jgi:RNA polymerase sigma factor (sigma-70 family)